MARQDLSMSSSVFLTMCIDPQLKIELREQARGEGCDLTEYAARELLRSLPASTKSRRNQAAARKPRLAHLAMLVGSDLKAKLEMQAAAEYRTFANSVAIQLQEIVDFYRENPIRPPCAVERRRHLQIGNLDGAALRRRSAWSLKHNSKNWPMRITGSWAT